MRRMLTREQLAALLMRVNVDDLSRVSGVSTKTIYRLRRQETSTTLDTVEALIRGIDELPQDEAKA